MTDPIERAGAEFFPDRVIVRLDVDVARHAAVEEVKRLRGNWKTDPRAMEHPVSKFVELEMKRLTHGDDHPKVREGFEGDPLSRIRDAVLLAIAEAAVAEGLHQEKRGDVLKTRR